MKTRPGHSGAAQVCTLAATRALLSPRTVSKQPVIISSAAKACSHDDTTYRRQRVDADRALLNSHTRSINHDRRLIYGEYTSRTCFARSRVGFQSEHLLPPSVCRLET